jgi:hypothetical protein
MLASSAKSVKHGLDVSALLHRYDSELILLIDPYQESLVLIVEDASSVGPVSVKAHSLQESIALLEKEVVVNKLLPLVFSKVVQGVVSSLEITFHVGEGFADFLLDVLSLVIGDTRT